MPKFMRHIRPITKVVKVKSTEADVMIEKNLQSLNVQRKLVDANIAPQPQKYKNDMIKKISIGTLSSRRTATHPYKCCVSFEQLNIIAKHSQE